MWRKGSVLAVGLVGALGFYLLAGSGTGRAYDESYTVGSSYVLKGGDCVSWPSGHSWYLRIASKSNYPFKVTTSNSSGYAVYACASATSGRTYGVYAKASSPNGYAVYASGNIAATGTMKADKLRYNSPRSYLLIVPSEAFVPASNLAYNNLHLAYINAASAGHMVAPVNLPQGAKVTGMMAEFYDTVFSYDVTVSLNHRSFGGSEVVAMAALNSSSIFNYGTKSTSSVTDPVISYASYGYYLDLSATNWSSGGLAVTAVCIYYQISEAE